MTSIPNGPTFAFNECASYRSDLPERGLTFIIRTDAAFATAKLKNGIHSFIQKTPSHPLHGGMDLEGLISRTVHNAYEKWGHAVLAAKAESIDYVRYNIEQAEDKSLHIHFYSAHTLTERAIDLALQIVAAEAQYCPDLPVMFISLDDMIVQQQDHWADIGFSRLFDHSGRNHSGYTGRPGMRALNEQIADAKEKIAALSAQHGGRKIPVVFLEDNVRHAKMLNWIIGLLDQQDFFDHADLAAISTCFCCAPEEERNLIQHNGKTVPLAIVIDYEQHLVDVCTPRDLMLDGFVVEIEGTRTRLPGIFMDVTERFKIHPEKADIFKQKVIAAGIAFCQTIEENLEVELPVAWFKGADAMAYVENVPQDTRMIDLLKSLQKRISGSPAPEQGTDAPRVSKPEAP